MFLDRTDLPGNVRAVVALDAIREWAIKLRDWVERCGWVLETGGDVCLAPVQILAALGGGLCDVGPRADRDVLVLRTEMRSDFLNRACVPAERADKGAKRQDNNKRIHRAKGQQRGLCTMHEIKREKEEEKGGKKRRKRGRGKLTLLFLVPCFAEQGLA